MPWCAEPAGRTPLPARAGLNMTNKGQPDRRTNQPTNRLTDRVTVGSNLQIGPVYEVQSTAYGPVIFAWPGHAPWPR